MSALLKSAGKKPLQRCGLQPAAGENPARSISGMFIQYVDTIKNRGVNVSVLERDKGSFFESSGICIASGIYIASLINKNRIFVKNGYAEKILIPMFSVQ